jgi:hypothetical protein
MRLVSGRGRVNVNHDFADNPLGDPSLQHFRDALMAKIVETEDGEGTFDISHVRLAAFHAAL